MNALGDWRRFGEMVVTLEWLRLKLIVDEAPGPSTAREFVAVEGLRNELMRDERHHAN
jgi:hypothetical protein